jgi:hypothetical protein
VVENIAAISKLCYVTVGIVVTDGNVGELDKIIRYAHSLGVSDIRVISAAQENDSVKLTIDESLVDEHPILRYRLNNLKNGRGVRGLRETDTHRCHLALDDMAVVGDKHFPCVIYMREQGNPIGKVGPDMRKEREEWVRNTDTFRDPICSRNCLDVCIDYNNKAGPPLLRNRNE